MDLTTCRGQRVADVLALEDEAKVDVKIKAKQSVKICGQMASSMPDAIVA